MSNHSAYLRKLARETAPHLGAQDPDLLNAATYLDDLEAEARALVHVILSHEHNPGAVAPYLASLARELEEFSK